MLPTDAVLAVTYRCNSQCTMCDIWKTKVDKEMELKPNDYLKLPTSLRNINISGGEPFLREDLPEIITIITERCHKARLVISTNGFSTALLKNMLPEILKIHSNLSIRFSLDGIGKKHQEMRCIEGAFDKVMFSLETAKILGVKDIGLSYTASNSNLDQLLAIYNLTKEKKVNFTICGVAHCSQIEGYFGSDNKDIENVSLLGEQLNSLIKERLLTWSPNLIARAYYDYGILYRELHKKRLFYCGAGDALFYMDPYGNVFPCNVANKKMGNILKNDFMDIWRSNEANSCRIFAKTCPYQCWMICTVSPYLKKRPLVPIFWVLLNKFKAHLGLNITRVKK